MPPGDPAPASGVLVPGQGFDKNRPSPPEPAVTTNANRYTHEEWETRLEGIDLEIVRQAAICQVHLFEPGVVERVASAVGRLASKLFRLTRRT